ncbi:unnamed protein product [Boreogadus saida]
MSTKRLIERLSNSDDGQEDIVFFADSTDPCFHHDGGQGVLHRGCPGWLWLRRLTARKPGSRRPTPTRVPLCTGSGCRLEPGDFPGPNPPREPNSKYSSKPQGPIIEDKAEYIRQLTALLESKDFSVV